MIDDSVIHNVLSSIPYIRVLDIKVSNDKVIVDIEIATEENAPWLRWKMVIDPLYPIKVAGAESIHFINKDLLPYPHIMEGGNLCLHTRHAYNVEDKLRLDIAQLKEWVDKYFVNKEVDNHYEHLVVNDILIDDTYYAFLFSDVDGTFSVGSYGIFEYANTLTGKRSGKNIITSVVTEYRPLNYGGRIKLKTDFCSSSVLYDRYYGIYCFIKEAPAAYGKFIVHDYRDLNPLLSTDQLHFIYESISGNAKKNLQRNGYVPLMVGYNLPDGSVHWQTAMLPTREEITKSYKVKIPGSKQNRWYSEFKEGSIQWAKSINSSYDHFYGRGAMNPELAKKSFLVLGVGAIGSMVSIALARNGAKIISFYDYDEKQPENICRSEYQFITGIGAKVNELSWIINTITPHAEVHAVEDFLFDAIVKRAYGDEDAKKDVVKFLDNFDVVFDCTTDNDLMHILDHIDCNCQIVNISISNHANELVCAFSPDITSYVEFIYGHIVQNETTDLYYPTGCWSPTFKASYTDISSMLQYGMKHILRMMSGEENMANFYLKDSEQGLRMIRL